MRRRNLCHEDCTCSVLIEDSASANMISQITSRQQVHNKVKVVTVLKRKYHVNKKPDE